MSDRIPRTARDVILTQTIRNFIKITLGRPASTIDNSIQRGMIGLPKFFLGIHVQGHANQIKPLSHLHVQCIKGFFPLLAIVHHFMTTEQA